MAACTSLAPPYERPAAPVDSRFGVDASASAGRQTISAFGAQTTDPAVGLATTYAPPLAWYNRTYGEIGDICNAQQGTVVGGDGATYVVQKEWSNARKACITQ